MSHYFQETRDAAGRRQSRWLRTAFDRPSGLFVFPVSLLPPVAQGVPCPLGHRWCCVTPVLSKLPLLSHQRGSKPGTQPVQVGRLRMQNEHQNPQGPFPRQLLPSHQWRSGNNQLCIIYDGQHSAAISHFAIYSYIHLLISLQCTSAACSIDTFVDILTLFLVIISSICLVFHFL